MPSLLLIPDSPHTALLALSLHDALPICRWDKDFLTISFKVWIFATGWFGSTSSTVCRTLFTSAAGSLAQTSRWRISRRSEDHTSELQSHRDLVCRLLL